MSRIVLDCLVKARDLVNEPNKLTRGTFARDAQENPIAWTNGLAVKFCMWGAVNRATMYEASWVNLAVIRRLQMAVGTEQQLSIFADESSHAQVMTAFGAAIEMEHQLCR